MKVKLNFKNKGFKVRLNDWDVLSPHVGNANNESVYHSYTMDATTAGALGSLLDTLKDVIGVIDSIKKAGFNHPSSGFDYKYSTLAKFRNRLELQHDKVDADLVKYRTISKTSVSYDLDRIKAIDEYLSKTFTNERGFKERKNIDNFYKKFSKTIAHKDKVNAQINSFIEESKNYSADDWVSLYEKLKQIEDLPGIENMGLFVGAKRGNTFGEIILTNNYGLPVVSMNAVTNEYKIIEPKETDFEDIDEMDMELDSLPNDTVEEKSDVETEDDEETFDVSLDDSYDPKGKMLVDTVLGVKSDPTFVGKANKKTIDKLSVLNDAKNLYEVFEEKTGKKVYGVGKSTGIQGEYYLLDENGSNIGIANVKTREVRDINDSPATNENIDKLLEDLKNDPENSNFNENTDSGYVESEDGRVLGIYYESGKDSKYAISLGEVEMYFNPDMEVQKYIGLFESYEAYRAGQEPKATKLISQNIYS